MFGLDELRKTKVAQELLQEGREEGREEGKLEVVPALLERGFTVEAHRFADLFEIAQILGLDVERVRQVVGK